MAYILLDTNIPAFHHSIIPFSGRIQKPKNIYYQWVVEIPRRIRFLITPLTFH
jgi:hypothetical protein